MESTISIADFLIKFPWTKEELDSGKVVERLWHYDLKISDDQLWPLICNSNLINKATGTKPITYTENGNLLYGTMGKDATREEWIEYPWEWVYCEWGKRVRKYTVSLITYNRVIYLIQKKAKGIRLYIYIGSTVKNPAHIKMVNQYLDSLEPKYEQVIKSFEHSVLEGQKIQFRELTPEMNETIERLLVPYQSNKLNVKLTQKLLEYILFTDEQLLGRIRLIPLARKWNVDLIDLVSISLHACKLGHLQLSWDTICPHCRGVRQENPYLSQIPLKGRCEICEIDFDTSSEGAVEVVFHVHPSIRQVKKIFYCAAEPHHKMHIKIQEHIPPGNSPIIEAHLPQLKYHQRIIGNADLHVKTQVKPSSLPDREQWNISVENPEKRPYTLIIEDEHFDQSDFLKPSYLFNHPDFRSLFNDEQLPLDLNMSLGLQALVFVDVVQSTKLYQDLGDAKSFNMIRHYMRDIFDVVHEHSGVVIKTMGDGAMFAFNSPLQALKASLQLQKLSLQSQRLKLRVGLNYGECIAVSFDSKIDYFGQTVNLASKLQMGSAPNDLVIAKKCYDLPEVKTYLLERGVACENFEVRVPGLEEKVEALLLKESDSELSPGQSPS